MDQIVQIVRSMSAVDQQTVLNCLLDSPNVDFLMRSPRPVQLILGMRLRGEDSQGALTPEVSTSTPQTIQGRERGE